jgi:hypothetical protein
MASSNSTSIKTNSRATKKPNVATPTESCGADLAQPPFRKSGSRLNFRVPKPKSINGAHAAGQAAAFSYLKHLRSGNSHHGETLLTPLVEAIRFGSSDRKGGERALMAFGFLSTLDEWLRLAAKHLGVGLDDLNGEQLGAQISRSLAMTEDQSRHDFRSRVAKSGWETRRQVAKGTVEVPHHA